MRRNAKLVMTFVGSIVFCVAIVGTVQALIENSSSGGAVGGGVAIGVGLAMLLIPWVPDND